MKNPLILTIDFGTQSVRASIFDKHGNCLAIHKKVYEPAYHSPKNGYAEQDPEYYYSSMCEVTNKLALSNADLLSD